MIDLREMALSDALSNFSFEIKLEEQRFMMKFAREHFNQIHK